MRYGFVTAVELGLGCLEEIYRIGGSVDLLMTLPDDVAANKSGRVHLDNFANDHGVELKKVMNVNQTDAIETIRNANLDWLLIIGWSQIARQELLESTARGCIGMHPTLLPVGRGRASIPWAILKGLKETGVTMFKLDAGVDTGPIIGQIPIEIVPRETATTLYAKVAEAHQSLMSESFPQLADPKMPMCEQNDKLATIWGGRSPHDGLIEATMSVSAIDRLVRATTRPYPGAFVISRDGFTSTVWSGSLEPVAGSRAIEAADGTYWATEIEDRC